jgi:hypothetical protein
MFAEVAREMLALMRIERTCVCDRCDEDIDSHEDALYRCSQCDIVWCVDCALAPRRGQVRAVPAPDPEVLPGDIFYLGPDEWAIHHTVIACTRMTPADPEVVEMLDTAPGGKVYECCTIESTRALSGYRTSWYASMSFFQRVDGSTTLIGRLDPDSGNLDLLEPVRAKLLMHPLRQRGFDEQLFREAVDWGAATSSPYGRAQAVKAFLAQAANGGAPTVIDAEEFTDPESRAALLEDVRQRWRVQPICASLCVEVWQMYFDLAARRSGRQDEAVQQILRWMPLYSNVVTPSALLNALSKCGWQVGDV